VIVVTALDQGVPPRKTSAPVYIAVADINDNAPIFAGEGPGGSYAVSVTENANHDLVVAGDSLSPPVAVLQVTATDLDAGVETGRVTYTIAGTVNTATTTLNPLGAAGVWAIDGRTGNVTLVGGLDREATPVVVLRVRATDGGTPSRSTTTDVTLTVKDRNDNSPAFADVPGNFGFYNPRILEDASIGEIVLTPRAVDADAVGTANSALTYSFSTMPPSRCFAINASTAVITVAAPLDRELAGAVACQGVDFEVTVMATDDGVPRRNGSRTVIISLDDINDNAPQFNASFFHASVSEDPAVSPLLGEVVLLEAHDPDNGFNAAILYSLTPATAGDPSFPFSIPDPAVGRVVLVRPVDREAAARYNITVIATDQGSPALSSTVQLEVTILDTNDNAPVFPPGGTLLHVLEDAPLGTVLGVVRADDADEGLNAHLVYTVDEGVGTDWRLFAVSPNGTVTTARAVAFGNSYDRERKVRLPPVCVHSLLASDLLLASLCV